MKKIEHPFKIEKLRELSLGDVVCVSGRIITGRDRFHKYLFDGGKSPARLKDGALFHCGPVVVRDNGKWITRATGPTTSMREELYMLDIIRQQGLRVIIGKGGMGKRTRKACAEYGCVYLDAVGGAAQVLNETVSGVAGVHFKREFGAAEAVWELDVVELPAIVTIDLTGKSLHARVEASSRRALRNNLKNGKPSG